MQSGFEHSSHKPEDGSALKEGQSYKTQAIKEQPEGRIVGGKEAVETGSTRPDQVDLWPRPPFYLRFPAILAGPLLAALIVWFGSGAILSAATAPSKSGTGITRAAPTVAKAQTTATPVPPTAVPTSPAAAVVVVAPTPAATPASAPTATPAQAPAPTPYPLAVANTGGDGVFLNRTPAAGNRIKGWPDRTILQVIGEDKIVDGQRWKYVRDPDGNEGWVPAQYLVDPSSLPAPTATPTPNPPTPTAAATATAAPAPTAPATATPPPSPTSPPAATATARPPAVPSPTAAAARTTPTAPTATPTPRP